MRGEPRNCELRISICEVATRACVRGETKRGTIVLPRLGSHTRARANGRSSDNVKATKGGNDTDYTLRRLARDKPELLDAIERGELSVNAAAIQAGIRKKPTSGEVCVREWKKTSNRFSHSRARAR